jgi:hypothetical protein
MESALTLNNCGDQNFILATYQKQEPAPDIIVTSYRVPSGLVGGLMKLSFVWTVIVMDRLT